MTKLMSCSTTTEVTRLLAAIAFGFASWTANAGTHFIHTDHLGTPIAMTDAVQTTTWQADYNPFGEADLVVELATLNLRFPGQYYDEETGLHYNYFRDYDPATGRYVQSDPIGLSGGINTYSYVHNNPLKFIDPDGLDVILASDFNGTGLVDETPIFDSQCERDCFWKFAGFGGLGGGLIAAGEPTVGKRFVTRASTATSRPASAKTSRASQAAGKIFGNAKLPRRLPAPTRAHPNAKTISAAKFVGRWVPFLGAGLLSYSVADFLICLDDCPECPK